MPPWEWPAFWDDISRISAAAILGGALGFEREWKGHWAGLRTHMMVSIGCAIFVIGGLDVAGDQPEVVTRVIQGLTAGIGFLGAGTILKLDQKQEIKGLTTASSIWLAGAIGTASGMGLYLVAVTGTVVALGVLAALRPVERLIQPDRAQRADKTDGQDEK